MDAIDNVQEAIDTFEHADPNHPPKQGFGTPLVMGLVAYSVVMTIIVVSILIATSV